jgi:endonuclease YncB( thermonuclease family)
MRRLVLVLALAGTAAGCDDAPAPPVPEGESATIEWVVDGDTVRLDDGREVRLVQIDAPEAGSDCFGRDATRALIALAKGERVSLERDPALDDVDTYGRLLRYVFAEGRNLNVALVADGAAAPYFFRNQRGRYAGALDDAVADARERDRGLWAACPQARLEPGLGSVTGPASSQRG